MVEKISGIYRIVCVKNGRYYYGSSVNVWRRWNEHKSMLKRGKHGNPIIQRSWNKYGESSFRIELAEAVVQSKLLEAEQVYLDEHVGKSNCMNIAKDAISGITGRKRSEETCRKISERMSGNNFGIGNKSWTGKIHKNETKLKIGKANRGKVPWNKGLTKKTDARIAITAIKIRKSILEGRRRVVSRARLLNDASEMA